MTQPLQPADLASMVTVGDPQITPDGRMVFFRRTAFDIARDRAAGAIWSVARDGEPSAFTGGDNDRMPRLDARGERLAFVRDDGAGGDPRIHIMALSGGEAMAIGDACPGISSLAWSPSGDRIAFTARAPFDAASAHVYLDEPSGVRHIRALPYKTDSDGLLDGRRQQVFVLDIAGGATRQRTSGDADAGAVEWSPDGTAIAYTIGAAAEASMISDVAVVDVASGVSHRITTGDGANGGASFSPDGTQLAWIGHRHGNDSRYGGELFVSNVDGTNRRSLSATLDRHIGNSIGGDLRSGSSPTPRWRDAHAVIAVVTDAGTSSLRAFDVRSGEVTVAAGGEREIYAFATTANGTLALAFSSALVPSEIALVTAEGERTLTDSNPWLRDKHVIAPRRIPATASDGTSLDAWLMLPADAIPGGPLVLEIHGGPHAAYGETFFLEFQILAGCGFGVVYGNPRGSAGYGQAFASAISADWGGIDASDVLAILDAGLRAAPFDTERIAAAGGSYGGFMTTWLLGHCDRFATGISMRACNDFVSFTGATDIGFFLEAELGAGVSARGMRTLFERSPMRAVEQIDAPLLIMHSERDYRCPIDQGEQLFNVLRMLGKSDAEFVRFTGDGHELSRGGTPRHRVLRLRAIANWLLRRLGVVSRSSGDDVAGWLFRPLAGEADDHSGVAYATAL
jgi:dipeptidyl aminopeptidase/acylaminoacyl peptidase